MSNFLTSFVVVSSSARGRVAAPAAPVAPAFVRPARWADAPVAAPVAAVDRDALASALAESRAAVPDVAPPATPTRPFTFVPSSLVVGRLVREASSFSRVAHGVVTSVSRVRGNVPGSFSAVVVGLDSGASFRCLASGLGGSDSASWDSLCAALLSCREARAHVSLVGAPGASGSVCRGFFCGVEVNSFPA